MLVWTQHPAMASDPHRLSADSSESKLGLELKKGEFEFHVRNFYMQTHNQGPLLNYATLATGAGMGYYSPSWKGFHVGFSGFFVFQAFQHNIYKPDPTTQNVNRYEILLYDMNDYTNRRDLDRLEELYIHYESNRWRVYWGRHHFNSPLLNEQDNRMRPNIFSGLSAQYQYHNTQVHGAWFNAVTVRGTVDWYSISESFGVYPFGRNPFGTPSQYKGNTHSRGIAVAGVQHQSKQILWQAWNYTAHNVFNLSMLQADWAPKRNTWKPIAGVQALYQTAVGNGGNADPLKSYILPNKKTYLIGAKAGIANQSNEWSVNYLNIGNSGRFLFPREWGREIFYASLPRERFEGNGALQATTIKYKKQYKLKGLSSELGASAVHVQELNNYQLNKYGIPSYYHLTALLDYRFSGYLEGLDIKILGVYKPSQNPEKVPDEFRINRVDLWHANLIIDYRF